jgi:hypothetical protein
MQKETTSLFVEPTLVHPVPKTVGCRLVLKYRYFRRLTASSPQVPRPSQKKKSAYNEAKATGIYFVSGHDTVQFKRI